MLSAYQWVPMSYTCNRACTGVDSCHTWHKHAAVLQSLLYI